VAQVFLVLLRVDWLSKEVTMDKMDKMKAIDLMIVLGGKPKKDKGYGKMENDDMEMDDSMEMEDKMCECPKCGEEFECENC